MAKLEELFTIQELASKWKVSNSYIRNKIRNGELRTEPIGGRLIRISQSAIDEFKSNNLYI